MKKEIESYAHKILLKEIVYQEASNMYLYTYNTSMLSLIVQFFIRSNWITEGLSQNAGAQNSDAINLNRLVKQACTVIKSSAAESGYVVFNDNVNG
jgi:hypothetical protein